MLYRVTVTEVTGPDIIDVDTMKKHLRVTNAQEDDVIQDLIDAGQALMADICNRVFIQQAQTLTLDYVPGGQIGWWDGVQDGAISAFQNGTLPLINPPLISVVEVATYGLDNVRSVFDPVNYFVDARDVNQFARINLNLGCIWPVSLRRYDAVEVLIIAGYPPKEDDTADYPVQAKIALKNLVAYLYEHRGEETGEDAITKSSCMGWLRPLIVHSPTIRAPRNQGRIGLSW